MSPSPNTSLGRVFDRQFPVTGGVKAGSPRPEGQVIQPPAPSSARPSSEMTETG